MRNPPIEVARISRGQLDDVIPAGETDLTFDAQQALFPVMVVTMVAGLEAGRQIDLDQLEVPLGLRGQHLDARRIAAGGNPRALAGANQDRKSTRLNSSHLGISYAV